ncbi:aminotransferase class I/II-fold pyridoxal phosphate-dependent enzyme [Saliterribacillus persicus]|uniref:Cystathionine beta-lyase family protein involved in aluminum resistance n=1 Tax=Saliterribacillus persicus TaxID=930114 RepID=A0A368XU07_9BACI|nr:methionine gamma-lyase family protein [Saliterribacillus persicus]RCW70636.1 cystathionine beta-lyase family protein involved in aluminum resistance [Saliterribacillus persicus]
MFNIQQEKQAIEERISPILKEIDKIAELNQAKVLQAFKENRVSDSDFNETTGYGYDDYGRDKLEAVVANAFGAEDSLMRPQIISGTHAISLSLFGLLRPNDHLIYLTGKPYDTLEKIIGEKKDRSGSLFDLDIRTDYIPLLNEKGIDWQQFEETLSDNTKVIAIQRSKGYADRPSFDMEQLEYMINKIRSIRKDLIVFVDNCYGEFVEEKEPTDVGADIMAGSLIKNPGGGLARTGGYIAGTKDLIDQVANQLTAPGIGKEIGPNLGLLREFYQGFFIAPHVVSEALKGSIFTSAILSEAGFNTSPSYNEKRTDLIQSVTFETAEEMVEFCQAIQHQSPINSHVTPYPASMPGYESDVIMAAGTFVQGASLELTADGPIRPPYTAYIQGGIIYTHVKLAIIEALKMIKS